ncbi:MAG: cobalt transporter [Thermoplasmata archaeon]
MKIPYLKAFAALLVILVVGLALFVIFSSSLADGLEKTMELGDVEEEEPFYHAPLDYGSDYFSAFMAGLIGLAFALLLTIGVAMVVRRRDART